MVFVQLSLFSRGKLGNRRLERHVDKDVTFFFDTVAFEIIILDVISVFRNCGYRRFYSFSAAASLCVLTVDEGLAVTVAYVFEGLDEHRVVLVNLADGEVSDHGTS